MGRKQKAVPGEDLAVETPWREFVVVCAKCSRKLDGGFGPDGEDSLRGALKDELRERGRRRAVRVVEAGCFGLCPKGGVAVAHGAARTGDIRYSLGDPSHATRLFGVRAKTGLRDGLGHLLASLAG